MRRIAPYDTGDELTGRAGRSAGAAAPLAHRPLDPFIDQLLHRVRPAGSDDVALLALRTPLPGETAPDWVTHGNGAGRRRTR